MSTGHADSPVTIVVGRAHKQTVTHPTGAAPRVVLNTALNKKMMKMDEDLTGNYPLSITTHGKHLLCIVYLSFVCTYILFSGIPEMFKTPANERKMRSLITQSSATKTPAGSQVTSVIEPSVLNTPEETGKLLF